MNRILLTYILLLISYSAAVAQEHLAPLYYRPHAASTQSASTSPRAAQKTTMLSLPFFEDFTTNNTFPDTGKWLDKKVYVNNSMGLNPVSRGVATFDAIAEDGLPYEQNFSGLLRYADSLTSQKIDLSGYSPSDSLYMSFYYQPQGNGFEPQPQDSLMLYMRKTSGWSRVWRVAGDFVQPFTQIMIPITQQSYFHDGFQIRFVNKASISNADDVWNVDYIRIGANRNINDTAITDIAFVDEPSPILKDYTFMPYHQYLANAANERAAQHTTSINNLSGSNVSVNYGYGARESVSNSSLGNGTGNTTLNAFEEKDAGFAVYTNTTAAPATNDYVNFENKYWLEANSSTGPVENDTIIHNQVFHNYYAYDDGSAEKSYYLKQYPTLPGKLAIEFQLTNPDTLKGVAIYFGRQVPLAYLKLFSLTVYRDIAYNGGSDQLILQEDFKVPAYLQQQHFYYYKFDTPVPLPAGKFYIGTIQPALSSSDSLYFGFDEDMDASAHTYYSVLNQWKESTIPGALMIRPLFGLVWPTGEHAVLSNKKSDWQIHPNPATDYIRVSLAQTKTAQYTLTNMTGAVVQRGTLKHNEQINISGLSKGVYLLQIADKGAPQKLIKL